MKNKKTFRDKYILLVLDLLPKEIREAHKTFYELQKRSIEYNLNLTLVNEKVKVKQWIKSCPLPPKQFTSKGFASQPKEELPINVKTEVYMKNDNL